MLIQTKFFKPIQSRVMRDHQIGILLMAVAEILGVPKSSVWVSHSERKNSGGLALYILVLVPEEEERRRVVSEINSKKFMDNVNERVFKELSGNMIIRNTTIIKANLSHSTFTESTILSMEVLKGICSFHNLE